MPRQNVDETRINRILGFLNSRIDFNPEIGIILGTGLGPLANSIQAELEIPYSEIPLFPQSTVQGHSGKLIFGKLSGRKVMAFSGRFHYYEGYTMQDMTISVRLMKALGVQKMIVSNAAGGVNPDYVAGQIVIIRDHINMFPDNPLRGVNSDSFGVRFPDMLYAYDRRFMEETEEVAEQLGIDVKRGVYLGLSGPNLETPAEYAFYHQVGADLVGMSTIPEVIVAKHAEIPVLAFSIVSNMCYPVDLIKETSIEDVIAVVNEASGELTSLVEGLLVRR
jgi:purine-nucleoside phosphorylase